MSNNPPPFKGLNIRIPIVLPIQGRGFTNQGSGLGLKIGSVAFTFRALVFGPPACTQDCDKPLSPSYRL